MELAFFHCKADAFENLLLSHGDVEIGNDEEGGHARGKYTDILDPMKVVARNKRARFDYEILEELEAGMILTGQEVKSVRAGNADLKGAYVSFLTGKPVLKNSTIQPYAYASNLTGYTPGRDRELLLRKEQLEKLRVVSEEQGISVLPLEFRADRMIKVLLGVGRGRKKIDKRKRIKEREVDRKLRKGEEW